MLGDDALVLDGHLPARERDHPRSRRDMPLEQRRPAEGRAHARDNSSDPRPRASRDGSVAEEARHVDLGLVVARTRVEARDRGLG
jgi:hypothetical protein